MRRRELLLLLGSALAVARAVGAQQKTMPVIGFLGTSWQDAAFVHPFRQGLSEIGYVDGNNVAMEFPVAHFTMISCLPWRRTSSGGGSM